MRCDICDRVLDEPRFNNDLDAYEPCDTCLAVILDTVGSYDDRAAASEDDLPDDPLSWAAVLARPLLDEEIFD